MIQLHICELETRSFNFKAASAVSAEDAFALMQKAWLRHCEQTSADPDFLTRDDCAEYILRDGRAIRDNEDVWPLVDCPA